MKTKYALIIVIALFAQAGYGQKNVDKLFNEFSKVENVTRLSMGNISMKIASIFTNVMGVDGIEVLSFDDCNDATKEKFNEAARNLKDSKFETMLTSNENNKRTRILVRIEEDTIHELVLLTTGSKNALIRIKGKIKPSDIDNLVNKHKNG